VPDLCRRAPTITVGDCDRSVAQPVQITMPLRRSGRSLGYKAVGGGPAETPTVPNRVFSLRRPSCCGRRERLGGHAASVLRQLAMRASADSQKEVLAHNGLDHAASHPPQGCCMGRRGRAHRRLVLPLLVNSASGRRRWRAGAQVARRSARSLLASPRRSPRGTGAT